MTVTELTGESVAARIAPYFQEAIEDREGLKVILILAEPIDEVLAAE